MTNDSVAPITFLKAVKDHLRLEGEDLRSLRENLKSLSKDDREWYRKAFEEAGIKIIPPSVKS